MGFSFPVSLNVISAVQLKALDDNLRSLKSETKALATSYDNSSPEHIRTTLDKITFLMERYTAIIFGAIMDLNGRTKLIINSPNETTDADSGVCYISESETVMKMLTNSLGPFDYSKHLMGRCTSYYSQMLKYEEVKFSPLGESIVMLMESYLENISRVWTTIDSNEFDFYNIVDHGISILNTVHLWIYQEIHLIPETIAYVNKKTEGIVKDKIVAKSRNSKLEKNRLMHDKIVNIFKELRLKNPKISKDAASREIEKMEGVIFSARVIAKHLSGI